MPICEGCGNIVGVTKIENGICKACKGAMSSDHDPSALINRYCSNCGEQLKSNDKFCMKCGVKVLELENDTAKSSDIPNYAIVILFIGIASIYLLSGKAAYNDIFVALGMTFGIFIFPTVVVIILTLIQKLRKKPYHKPILHLMILTIALFVLTFKNI